VGHHGRDGDKDDGVVHELPADRACHRRHGPRPYRLTRASRPRCPPAAENLLPPRAAAPKMVSQPSGGESLDVARGVDWSQRPVMTHKYRGCIVVLSINKSVEPNEEQKVLMSSFDQGITVNTSKQVFRGIW
jgi:hypothetical protein